MSVGSRLQGNLEGEGIYSLHFSDAIQDSFFGQARRNNRLVTPIVGSYNDLEELTALLDPDFRRRRGRLDASRWSSMKSSGRLLLLRFRPCLLSWGRRVCGCLLLCLEVGVQKGLLTVERTLLTVFQSIPSTVFFARPVQTDRDLL